MKELRKQAIQNALNNLNNVSFKEWTGRNIHRIYINDADRNSLGYFESRSQQSGKSYYDNHRAIKGDSTVHSDATCHSDEQGVKDLFEALTFVNADGHKRADIMVIAHNLILNNVGY